jgi:thiamine biosynthesis lipoprotein
VTSANEAELPGASRLAHAEEIWGTVVSLHLRGSDDDVLAAARGDIVEFLHRVDDVFDADRADSALSRWQRDEIAATPELQDVLALAGTVAILTHGAFDAKWNGAPDPTGIVKGWAVDRAVEIAASYGVVNLVINAGGNVSTRGSSGSGGPWRVGVADPAQQRNVLSIVGHELNVATSGAGLRGEQIQCRSGRTAAAATVVGPNLAIADGIATAAIAAGPGAEKILTELDGSGWLSQVIGTDGAVWRSPNFARLLA